MAAGAQGDASGFSIILPAPDRRLLGAADVRDATLTALKDRFVWIIPNSAAL